jgi:hypothetical protein
MVIEDGEDVLAAIERGIHGTAFDHGLLAPGLEELVGGEEEEAGVLFADPGVGLKDGEENGGRGGKKGKGEDGGEGEKFSVHYMRLSNLKAAWGYGSVKLLMLSPTWVRSMMEGTMKTAMLLAAVLLCGFQAHTIGWYNGDWQSGIPGLRTYYASASDYSCVYDSFVVPGGGWVVSSVLAHIRSESPLGARAFWEIRKDVSAGNGGTVVASDSSEADVQVDASVAYAHDGATGYTLRVDGLHVRLEPGRYWLTVAPMGKGQRYLSATVGANSVGKVRGDGGIAFFNAGGQKFMPAESVGSQGQLGVAHAFSQGVMVEAAR